MTRHARLLVLLGGFLACASCGVQSTRDGSDRTSRTIQVPVCSRELVQRFPGAPLVHRGHVVSSATGLERETLHVVTRRQGRRPDVLTGWDLRSKERLFERELGSSALHAWSPDGSLLARVPGESGVRVLEVPSMEVAASIDSPARIIRKVGVSAAGHRVATWSLKRGRSSFAPAPREAWWEDPLVRVWDVRTGELLGGHDAGVSSRPTTRLRFSRDGRRLAWATRDDLVILDLDRGTRLDTPIYPVRGPRSPPVTGLRFSHDGDLLAVHRRDGPVRLVDASSGIRLATLHDTTGLDPHEVAFSPDGKRLAVATDRIRIWSLDTGELLGESHELGPCDDLTFTRTGDHLNVPSGHWVHIFDGKTGRRLASEGHQGAILSLGFSPGERRLATVDDRGELRVWDLRDGRLLHLRRGLHPRWQSFAFSPDGRLLAHATSTDHVEVWDLDGSMRLRRFGPFPEHVGGVAFSPDGRWLAVGAGGPSVTLCSVARPAESVRVYRRSTRPRLGRTEALTFSREGHLLAVHELDGPVRVFSLALDTSTGATVRHLTDLGCSNRLCSPTRDHRQGLAFAPHGELLVWSDWAVDRFDPETGELLGTLEPRGAFPRQSSTRGYAHAVRRGPLLDPTGRHPPVRFPDSRTDPSGSWRVALSASREFVAIGTSRGEIVVRRRRLTSRDEGSTDD